MRSLASIAESGTATAKALLRNTMPANTALAAMGVTLGACGAKRATTFESHEAHRQRKLTRRQVHCVNARRAAESCDQSHRVISLLSYFPACVVKRQNTTSNGCTSYTPKLLSA